MWRHLTVLIMCSLIATGCSRVADSRLNPANWGSGNSRPAQTDRGNSANPLIPEDTSVSIFKRNREEVYEGTPVDRIASLAVEHTTDGAIVKVTGITLQQGAYDVRITSESEGDPVNGVLLYDLKAIQPTNTPQGPPYQRTVHAGRFVSKENLALTQRIIVRGLRNEHVSTP